MPSRTTSRMIATSASGCRCFAAQGGLQHRAQSVAISRLTAPTGLLRAAGAPAGRRPPAPVAPASLVAAEATEHVAPGRAITRHRCPKPIRCAAQGSGTELRAVSGLPSPLASAMAGEGAATAVGAGAGSADTGAAVSAEPMEPETSSTADMNFESRMPCRKMSLSPPSSTPAASDFLNASTDACLTCPSLRACRRRMINSCVRTHWLKTTPLASGCSSSNVCSRPKRCHARRARRRMEGRAMIEQAPALRRGVILAHLRSRHGREIRMTRPTNLFLP